MAVLLPISGKAAIEALIERQDIVELLQGAVKRSNGRHTFETLVNDLTAGRAMLWIRKNSVIVTELIRYPTGVLWLALRIGAGHMATLKAMMPGIEEYAKEKGYAGVEGVARTGWARVGKRMGYAETHRFLEKAL